MNTTTLGQVTLGTQTRGLRHTDLVLNLMRALRQNNPRAAAAMQLRYCLVLWHARRGTLRSSPASAACIDAICRQFDGTRRKEV